MRAAFVGSRCGLTASQRFRLRACLSVEKPSGLVHGGGSGGDDEADQVAAELGIPRVVAPSMTATRSQLNIPRFRDRTGSSVVVLTAMTAEERRSVLASCKLVIACPSRGQNRDRRDFMRSPVWSVVNRARRWRGTRVVVIEP